MSKILNVVILYDNEAEVYDYAVQLSKQEIHDQLALIIVVNKTNKSKFRLMSDKLSNLDMFIEIHTPDKNLGYLNGLIYGYEHYIKRNEKPKFVIMSNTDIEFADNTFIKKLIMTNYDENVWCVAPSVYSPTKKSYDNPQYKTRYTKSSLDKRIFIFNNPYLGYPYVKLSQYKARFKRANKQDSCYVYSAHGCFFIIKPELADILISRPYKGLMYSEEAYIAELIRESDKRCFYDANIEVLHLESTVTSKLAFRKKSKFIAESLEIVRDEFF
ncbi:hypothetical protein [Aquibacillus saliphilus]|uniref:hypothetical protein n=1 Tax=Aquibacillus saliphilus TaxID=1909422 RepID=UPI001CEFCE43|nr:hypothetical protein [Aquibacillus saliphilus]